MSMPPSGMATLEQMAEPTRRASVMARIGCADGYDMGRCCIRMRSPSIGTSYRARSPAMSIWSVASPEALHERGVTSLSALRSVASYWVCVFDVEEGGALGQP